MLIEHYSTLAILVFKNNMFENCQDDPMFIYFIIGLIYEYFKCVRPCEFKWTDILRKTL